MWNQPYLETCCRSALHRLSLSADVGRPSGLKDDNCLERLCRQSLATRHPNGRFLITQAGRERHCSEVLKQQAA